MSNPNSTASSPNAGDLPVGGVTMSGGDINSSGSNSKISSGDIAVPISSPIVQDIHELSRIHLGSDSEQGSAGSIDTMDVEMNEVNFSPVVSPIRNPVDVAKKLVAKRDQYMALLTDMISGTELDNEKGQHHISEMRIKIEEMNRLISTIKHSVKLSGDRVAASINGAASDNGSGISLSKRDLPKFQLKSGMKYFAGEESYESVFHFLRIFEKVISSSGQGIEQVWKRYLPLTIPYEFDLWLNEELLKAESWKEAGDIMSRKFNNSLLRLNARRAVQSATMEGGETTEHYYNRFARSAMEAGYAANDTSVADAFLNGFPNEWQIQITTLLCTSHPNLTAWTSGQVFTCALNILGNSKCPMTIVGRANGGRMNNTNNNYPSKGERGRDGRDGRNDRGGRGGHQTQANNNQSFGNERKGGNYSGSTKYLGKKNVPRLATGNEPCDHCGKIWFEGHKCREFYENKRLKVLSIKRMKRRNRHHNKKNRRDNDNDNDNNNDKRSSDAEQSNWFRQAVENSSDCKPKVKTNHEFNLITPLLINDTRILGKVDPGSDISIINKSILNKKFSNIKNIKALGGYLMFLGNNNDGSPNSTKRIGTTEPLKVTYMNGITFKHSFEIIEFNDEMAEEFDVLLGVDILPLLNIYLSGVAHKWPDHPDKEIEQFRNINYDTDNAYNPENADYGTLDERKLLMKQIEKALNNNKEIPPDAVCTMPESEVHIPISNPKDCYVRQYPLAINAYKEIDKQIKEWLENKIVERCKPSSVFHSPLLAVGKKDENNNVTKLRICCDLRKINAAIDDNYHENLAVPKIHEIFERVSANARIISKIDLHQAYYSYGVNVESRNALIFSHNGLYYRWSRAPFGLKFMSSLFVKNMSILLEGIQQELHYEMKKLNQLKIKGPAKITNDLNHPIVYGGVEHYIDDVVLYSRDIKSHIILINLVINRLTNVNLRINVAKCAWFQTSVFLLGFVVGPGIQKIDMRRLSNIDTWQIPKTAKQVRSIMGVISHLRDYCPMLSKVAEPLDKLRNDKDVKNNWTQLHTDRFDAIKQILQSNQILHAPNLNEKMYLQGDASVYGIAACLYQKDSIGRIKHIGFVSKSLNQAERNWSTNRRECAAIVFGFVKFKSVLWGHPNIEVLTDHLALTFMFTSTGLNSTLQSYLEILGEYSFTISHVKGINNVLCDALSRIYPPIEEDKLLENENDRQIKKLQKLILIKRASNNKKELVKETTFYAQDVNLNVLAIKLNSKEFKSKTTDYVCPPVKERAQIIKDAHELGHFGEASVIDHIHTYHGLHWTSIYSDCKDILKSCRECAQHNITRKGFNPAKSIVSFDAMDFCAFDLLGPLPATDKGNIYVLVMIDLCTRYVIVRALPNKNSSTIAQAILNIFGDYGVALSVQLTDNGKEFRCMLMNHFAKTLSIKHNYSLPYYKQSNGSCENAVKNVTQTLRKMCGNDTHNWDDRLAICQLVINMKVKQRTGSTPFSLMFARQVNTNREVEKLNLNGRKALTVEELEKRVEYMNDIVFPAIQERTKLLAEEYSKKLDKKRYILEDIPFDSAVMVRLPEGRQSKLAPLYAGPYIVVRRTMAGNYILKDETNELLHREYTPSELKLVNIDETALESEYFEVEDIRDHRTRKDGVIEYLVKWSGYSDRENEYITEDLFSTPLPIKKYWEKIRRIKESQKQRVNKNNSTTKNTNRSTKKRSNDDQNNSQRKDTKRHKKA